MAGEVDWTALASAEPVPSYVGAAFEILTRSSVPHGQRISIPTREQRHVDRGVFSEDPALEHDAAAAGNFQSVAGRRHLACFRVQLTVWPVKRDELLDIGE